MAKRRFRNKKVRFVAISASLATAGAAVTLFPSAHAAEQKTPQEIMNMCNKARFIDGKEQTFGSGLQDRPLADSCDYVETKFEVFDGPTEKVTVDFPNCAPDINPNAKVRTEWSTSVTQGKGKYSLVQSGGALFGVINLGWQKHKGTMDLTLKTATVTESTTRAIRAGTVLHVEFTPKLQRMTGKWVVKINGRPGSTVTNPVEAQTYEAEDVIEGPVILPSAAGGPGVVDGVTKAIETNC